MSKYFEADAQEREYATSSAELADRLPAAQHAALSAITAGSSFRHAGEVAGVSRATVYRWVQSDPLFRAALNAWQKEIKESSRARLMRLADQAVSVIETALNRNDERIALTMLKELGVMRRSTGGLTDPSLLKMQMDLRHQRRQYQLSKASLRYLLTKAGYSKGEQRQILLNPQAFLAQLPTRTPSKDQARRQETTELPAMACSDPAQEIVDACIMNESINANETK